MATDYLNAFDYTVIGLYMTALVGLGLWLRKRASASLDDYLVGGRSIPWWVLGISGMASYLDVAGTMIIVSFLYMLGPRGLFIEFRGGAVLVLALMMLWTGKWHRRSGCLTGAEWMIFRFGDGPGGRFAQLAKATATILWAIGMLAYLVKGIGLFLSMFLPFPPAQCAMILIGVATVYTMVSGFYGVVFTDFFQSVIILIAVTVVTSMAVTQIHDGPALAELATQVTGNHQWIEATPRWNTPMPPGYEAYQALILFAGFYLLRNILTGMGTGDDPKYFGAKSDAECSKLSFLWTCLMTVRWPMMMGFAVLGLLLVNRLFPDRSVLQDSEIAVKQYLVAEAGLETEIEFEELAAVNKIVPKSRWQDLLDDGENADAEQVVQLEARLGEDWGERLQSLADQEEEVQEIIPKEHWEDTLAGIDEAHPELASRLEQTLGDEWQSKTKLLSYEGTVNPERIMPAVLLFDIPAGFRGLLLIALIAASMSTFDSNVNLTAGLFVRDIYQKHLRPTAGIRELIFATWAFILALVVVGFLFAYSVKSINDIWDWIIMGLGGGLLVPLILRLYWWRFNGGGFAIGLFVGMAAALLQRWLMPEMDPRLQFVYIAAIGLVASVAGTFLTAPTRPEVLEHFYRTTRPFGVWGPLKRQLSSEERRIVSTEHRRDLTAVPFALTWQVMIFLTPMLMVVQNWKAAAVCGGIALVSLVGLYFVWLRHINEPMDIDGPPTG